MFLYLFIYLFNFFVKSRASRWTGRCLDKVFCLVNSDDKIPSICLNGSRLSEH